MKKISKTAAALCAALLAANSAGAAGIELVVGKPGAVINGEEINIAAPYMVNWNTLVPLEVIKGLGADVSEDGGRISIELGNTFVVLENGSDIALVNGEERKMPAAAEYSGETAMVPVRFVSETLGAAVSWSQEEQKVTILTNNALEMIDNTAWNYNAEDGVYWQVGIKYCANPVDEQYQTMGIFVPEAYMTAADNGDGTFTCAVNPLGEVNGYTAETAPMVIPVDTPGYSAMKAPTGYVSDAGTFADAGFIYVNAGCRGRDRGAPAGVTDLKAAIRYVRYNSSLPGDTDSIFTFGMSGGGAQSALVGATGNSALYNPYLEAIGAVMDESDSVKGSMCWCPITNLDMANEAYEWNMGITRTNLSEDMQALSDSMAESFAEYINAISLKDENGNVLTLEESENGIYQAGSYYDYVKGVIERSLNNFLEDTVFPYTPQSGKGFGGGMPMGGGLPMDGEGRGGRGEKPEIAGGLNEFEAADGIMRAETSDTADSSTYETAQDYIDSLNKDSVWINYDAETNTATITSVEDFVKACKNASKSVGAFDDLNAAQGENTLFGYGDGQGAHFDQIMAQLLKDSEYGEAYAADLEKEDAFGNTVDVRMNMYNPMYYINDYYDGAGQSDAADFWRIRTGINQGDTALSTEINLVLALREAGKNVDFETIWGQGHVTAERTGDSTTNFIAWVNECMNN